MSRRALWTLLKLGIAGTLIFIVVRPYFVGENEIPLDRLERLRETWPWLLLAQLPFGVVLLLAASRWRILLRAQGIEYGLRDAHALTLIGVFFNQFMPGSSGGDVIKAYYVAAESPGRRTAAALTVFIDRAIGLVVLVLVASVAVLLNLELVTSSGDLSLLAVGLWVALGAALIGVALFFLSAGERPTVARRLLARLPFQRHVIELRGIFSAYRHRRREALWVLLHSLGIHTLVVATNLCLLRALEPVFPNPLPFLLVVPVAQIVMAVPITPAGLGTGELAYEHLFGLAGFDCGLLVSLLQRASYYFWALFGCVAYLRRRGGVRRALEAASASAAPGSASSPESSGGGITECSSVTEPAATR